MPVEVKRLDLGAPPTRTVTRGPLAGTEVPRFEVILPGWSDVIRVNSSSSLTPVEAAVERQRRTAQLKRSPTPEVLQNLAKVGQAVDDAQDALVTLSLAGRIATKLLGATIPGVGLISSAADVLNMLNVFYPKAAAGAVVGAVTRGGGKISGRKKYLGSKAVKRALGLAPDASLSTYLRRLNETVKTGKVNVGLGELLQVGQTAEALTGYGIALGPIFGGIQDTISGLVRGARFDVSGPLSLTGAGRTAESLEQMRAFSPGEYEMYKARAEGLARSQSLSAPTSAADVSRILRDNPIRVQVDFPGVIPAVDVLRGVAAGTTEGDVSPYLTPAADVINKGAVGALSAIAELKKNVVYSATRVLDAGKWLVGLRGDLSWSDHIELTCAQFLAMQELMPLLEQVDWSIPVVDRNAIAIEVLPFCGEDHAHPRDSGSVSNCLARGPARLPFDWVDEAPSPEARQFSVALIDACAELVPVFLEGRDVSVVYDSGAFFRAARLMHEYDLLPPYERVDIEVLCYSDSLSKLIEASGGSSPAFEIVQRLYLHCFPGVALD